MKAILLLLLCASTAFGQRISEFTSTNVAAGTNLFPIVVAPGVAGGTFKITVANLNSNSVFSGVPNFSTNGLTLNGTNVISASAGLTNTGAMIFTDGTNLLVVFQNAAGARTTNKLSKSSWP